MEDPESFAYIIDDDYGIGDNEEPLQVPRFNQMKAIDSKNSPASLETFNGDDRGKEIFYGKLFKAVSPTKLQI